VTNWKGRVPWHGSADREPEILITNYKIERFVSSFCPCPDEKPVWESGSRRSRRRRRRRRRRRQVVPEYE
jgi:hypothetical protein